MTCFAEASPEGRALIPNFMQPSPRNNIKKEEIYKKRVIHTLTMKNIDNLQSSSREEPPYTLYWVHKEIYNDDLNGNIFFIYIGDHTVQ